MLLTITISAGFIFFKKKAVTEFLYAGMKRIIIIASIDGNTPLSMMRMLPNGPRAYPRACKCFFIELGLKMKPVLRGNSQIMLVGK